MISKQCALRAFRPVKGLLSTPHVLQHQNQRLAGSGQRPQQSLNVEMGSILRTPHNSVGTHPLREKLEVRVGACPHPVVKDDPSFSTQKIRRSGPCRTRANVIVVGDITRNVHHVMKFILLDVPGPFRGPRLAEHRGRGVVRTQHREVASRYVTHISAAVRLHDLRIVFSWSCSVT
jgi:hypothetical protein